MGSVFTRMIEKHIRAILLPVHRNPANEQEHREDY